MTLSAMGNFQPTPAYKVSKTAVNMLTVQWAESLESDGFAVLAICPGVSIFFTTVVSNCSTNSDGTVGQDRYGN